MNGTNTTMTYYEKQLQEEKDKENNRQPTTQFYIPKKLVMTVEPSTQSNETVPLPIQPELRMFDVQDRWVQNLGTSRAPWMVTVSLVAGHGDPDARLEGILTVPFINGTANFSDLSISHNGSYMILYEVTYPSTVSFSMTRGPYVIKERHLDFKFTHNLTDIYDSVPFMPQPAIAVYDSALGTIVETGWKNREWIVTAELMKPSDSLASIYGSNIAHIYNGTSSFHNLSIDAAGQFQFKFIVTTFPTSSYHYEYTTPQFTVKERQFYVNVARQIDNCNDTVVCGEQPVVELRSVYPDMLALNLNNRGRKWFVNASLCNAAPNNPLKGTTYLEIPDSAAVQFTDLYLDYFTLNQQVCFDVMVEPETPKHANLTAMSASFNVNKRQMYLAVAMQPDKANETIVFGQQPVIQIMDVGTGKPAFPLRESWQINVTMETNPNNGALSGSQTVNVVGTKASFTDLAISAFGVGYELKFVSNHGQTVRIFSTIILLSVHYCNDVFLYPSCIAEVIKFY